MKSVERLEPALEKVKCWCAAKQIQLVYGSIDRTVGIPTGEEQRLMSVTYESY